MERKRRISAPFLRTGLNNYRQSKTAAQPENTIIALIQAGITDNIFSPIMFRFPDAGGDDRSHVMRSQSRIIIGQDDLAFLRMRHNTGLKIVAYGSHRNAAKVFIHMDMASDKGIHLHV